MSDVYKQRAGGALPAVESETRPLGRLVILDYVFYVVLAALLAGFLYYLYQYRDTITLYTPYLLQAAGTTIFLSITSMILASIFGFIGALGRLSSLSVIRWIAVVYVEVVRGVPILVQLLFWYFGIGQVLSTAGFSPYQTAFQVLTAIQSNSFLPGEAAFNGIFYGVIGLSFNYGAYLTEVFRTGIESVPYGQTEASLSLGLTSRQVMRRIILPQAFRITIPPFTNYFITLVQDSSLLSTISVLELQQQVSSFADPQTNANIKFFVYILGALFYLAICYPLALLARYLEGRMSAGY